MTLLNAVVYENENLFLGQLGHFFVILSFIATAFAAYSFNRSSKKKEDVFLQLGRKAFTIHTIAVIGIIATLFWMLFDHRYEYYYVWKHSSNNLPLRFIFSCFWEGQEGSFLLWTFWHVVLGNILMRTAKNWQAPVMMVFSVVQIFLTSMLLGVYIPLPEMLGEVVKIGSSPFTLLLREHPDFLDSPIFQSADYLSKIDGNGLNPLLQNYWMTIHPPVLFLGFASTLIPFAFAIAALREKKFTEWVQPVIPWMFFGVMILGIGILMGGAWAYEALSFGGFWAWDPVENASLMPWLTFVAAAHILIIKKIKKTPSYVSFLLTILTFLFVLYSTYLTRSGILGDTSVHSFAGGLPGQLIVFMAFFFLWGCYELIQNKVFGRVFIATGIIGAGLLYFVPDDLMIFDSVRIDAILKIALTLTLIFILVMSYSNFFPKTKKEDENITSREFWMFIGSLFLMISAIQIIISTSLPVFNELIGTDMVLEEPIPHYNKNQMPIAAIICLLMAFTQFLKYRKTDISKFWKSISLSLILAFAISLFIGMVSDQVGLFDTNNLTFGYKVSFLLLTFATVWSVVANTEFIRQVLKGKISKAGGSISHIGFALILLGAFISTSHQKVISQNTSDVNINSLTDELENKENILLKQNDTLPMGDYYVTFQDKWKEGIYVNFEIDYLSENEGEFTKEFSLIPTVQTNERMGNVAEPGTRHFLHKDIYTHVQWADLDTTVEDPEAYGEPKEISMKQGDTITTSKFMFILEELNKNIDREKYGLDAGDLALGAKMRVVNATKDEKMIEPVFVLNGNEILSTVEKIDDYGVIVQFVKIDPGKTEYTFRIYQKNGHKTEFIILKAIEFPMINILWAGCIIMLIGGILSVVQRARAGAKVA